MSRLLHAGFHKTGSTFLQKEFFPNLENVVFIRRLNFGKLPILNKDNISVLLSSEVACGFPIPYAERFTIDRIEGNIILFSIEKVIIVQREFYSWVLSLYYQTLNEKHSWSLEGFISNSRDNPLTWKTAAQEVEETCNIRVQKRTNASRYVQRTIAAYRFLIWGFNNKFDRLLEKVIKKLPRIVINSKLSLFLDKISPWVFSVEEARRSMS